MKEAMRIRRANRWLKVLHYALFSENKRIEMMAKRALTRLWRVP